MVCSKLTVHGLGQTYNKAMEKVAYSDTQVLQKSRWNHSTGLLLSLLLYNRSVKPYWTDWTNLAKVYNISALSEHTTFSIASFIAWFRWMLAMIFEDRRE